MSNPQELAINFTYFLYNLKPTEVELKEQMPIYEQFYNEGDSIKLPIWYAKMIRSRKVCDVPEFLAFDRIFNNALGDQMLNKISLVHIPRDFYFVAIDYINSLKNGKCAERKEKLIEFKDSRRKIILRMIELDQDTRHKAVKDMAFEELIFYYSMLKVKQGSYKNLDNLMLEDEE